MATIASIAARRDISLARIAKALKIEFTDVRGSSEDRHAGELEQIADKVDPDNAPPPVDPETSRMRAREGPPPSHEEAIAASMPQGEADQPTDPLPETSDERHEPQGRDEGQPVQGGGRPAPEPRGDRQRNPRPR